jgi:mannose-6-phosphate isomerase-like protein (cupin superfamily)
MKYLLALVTVVAAAVLVSGQTAQPARGRGQAPAARGQAPAAPVPVTKVMFFDHDKVATTFAKGGNLVNAPDMIVLGSHRDVAGQVEVHDKETDVIYVTDGEANFVTGGTMVGGKVSRPGQWLGTDITGGQMQHLTKGDMIIVPAGIPHWFKEIPKAISYYVVKVVKP